MHIVAKEFLYAPGWYQPQRPSLYFIIQPDGNIESMIFSDTAVKHRARRLHNDHLATKQQSKDITTFTIFETFLVTAVVALVLARLNIADAILHLHVLDGTRVRVLTRVAPSSRNITLAVMRRDQIAVRSTTRTVAARTRAMGPRTRRCRHFHQSTAQRLVLRCRARTVRGAMATGAVR